MAIVEAGEIHRPRITPERPFAAQIEVSVEITQRQFAQRPINRLAITAAGEVRFRDRAPVPAHFENREHVVGVLVRFQIEDERRKSESAERGRGEDRAFEAMGRFFSQHSPRRPGGAGEMIRHSVEEALDSRRRLQRAQGPQFAGSEWRNRHRSNPNHGVSNRGSGASRGISPAGEAAISLVERRAPFLCSRRAAEQIRARS